MGQELDLCERQYYSLCSTSWLGDSSMRGPPRGWLAAEPNKLQTSLRVELPPVYVSYSAVGVKEHRALPLQFEI